MHLRSKLFAVALSALGLAASSASAATVTYTLDLSVDNAFTLLCQTSAGDNAGLSFYSAPLTGDVLTLDHRSPYAVNSANFAPAGFNVLRSGDSAVPASNPQVLGSQDSVTGPAGNLIYGFGQEASSFAAKGITPIGFPDPTSDIAWLNPLVLATGTYNRLAGTLAFNTGSADLVANVFAAVGTRDTPAATVMTTVIPFGVVETNTAPVVTPELPLVQTTNGQVLVQDFDAVDTETPGGPFDFNVTLLSFSPLFPGGVANSALPTINDDGLFSWDTSGAARGLYTYNITAADAGPGDPLTSQPTGFDVTITAVPEPTTLTLFGLAMVGAMGFVRRRNS